MFKNLWLFRVLTLGLVATFYPAGHATLVEPSDVPYRIWATPSTDFIYEAQGSEFIAELSSYHQMFRRRYDRSFRWRLNETQDLILVSERMQIGNAYAEAMPNLKSVWYPSGAGYVESAAASSWALLLDAHETSHLYQLSAQSRVGRTFKSVLGNTLFFYPFIWPIFPQPNFVLPTSILEGNAVLNESRIDMGGRLHSGEVRALVYAQIAAGRMNATRLINDEFEYPFGENAYVQGAYFQAHLAEKYGVDQVNSFFIAQAEHYLLPLILNQTFRDHFGRGYYDELHEHLHALSLKARRQKFAPGESLDESLYYGALNQDSRTIFWVGTDQNEPAYLNIYDKASGQLTQTQMDLPTGKVFFVNGEPRVAASLQHDLHHLEYSLYGEHSRFDPGSRGQIVTDQRAGKRVSLDAGKSWKDGRVLVDNEPYDIAHSNPILDEEGAVYYFRQDGPERVCYRNREPLFKYTGFYGKLTEVGADGSVDFIANTEFGSTLYRYEHGEITRQLESDRVIDAKRIDTHKFLVVEVGVAGHRTMLAPRHPTVAEPVAYHYAFQNEPLTPDPAVSVDDVRAKERSYNAVRDLRYSSLDAAFYVASRDGAATSLTANFTDPLEYHRMSLGYASTFARYQEALVEYDFTKILPQIYLRYWYRGDHFTMIEGGEKTTRDSQVLGGLTAPFIRWRNIDAGFNLGVYYSDADTRHDPAYRYYHPAARETTYGALSKLNFRWAVPTSLGFYNWREVDLSLTNRLDTLPGLWEKHHNTSQFSASYTHGFHEQFYATASAGYSWAENADVNVRYSPYALVTDLQVDRLTSHGEYNVRNAAVARLEVSKVFDAPLYSTRIPIGLQRLAPLLVAQDLAMDRDPYGVYPANIFEWGLGADVEVLLAHKLVARTRLLSSYDTNDPRYNENSVMFHLKRDF